MGDAAEKQDEPAITPAKPANDQRVIRDWYTVPQAAEYLGTTPAGLHMHIHRGNIVPDKRGGRGCFKGHRFSRATLDAFGARR